jgi:hypothetical protein
MILSAFVFIPTAMRADVRRFAVGIVVGVDQFSAGVDSR